MSEKNKDEELRESKQEVKLLKTINDTLKEKSEILKKVMNDMEEKILQTQISAAEAKQEKILSEHIDKMKNNNNPSKLQKSEVSEKSIILNLFGSMKQISFSLLSTMTKMNDEKLKEVLLELESEEKIMSLGETKEPICNECGFLQLESLYRCPKCDVSNFDTDDILEHFDCGNISRRLSYVDDKCPQCNKEIKALGVDYKKGSKIYFCNQCNEKFQQPELALQCRKCNTLQTLQNANWVFSQTYRLVSRK